MVNSIDKSQSILKTSEHRGYNIMLFTDYLGLFVTYLGVIFAVFGFLLLLGMIGAIVGGLLMRLLRAWGVIGNDTSGVLPPSCGISYSRCAICDRAVRTIVTCALCKRHICLSCATVEHGKNATYWVCRCMEEVAA